MSKIVIFDLYDTLLKGLSFDFDKGVEYLHQQYFQGKCSLEEFIEYSKSFLPMYEARKETNKELCFIVDELPLYFEHYGVPVPADLESVEYAFLRHLEEHLVLDEVKETLEALQQRNIPMYVLSNSIFTGKTACKYIASHGILHYLQKVYSSGDYGVRKPGREFFDIAVTEILQAHPEATREDIYFVGNDYSADAVGGVAAELKTIWYNVGHLPNEKNLPIWDISDFREVIKVIEE